jgi:alkylation response protein AidB-like acyl-CoA dehydrogenase
MHAMDWERVGLSAIHVGTMRKVLEKSKTYSKIRTQGGVSNSSHQSVAFQLADMAVATESSELMVRAAAANLKSSAKQRTLGASMCKLFVSESLVQQCRAAIQLHGGNGYIRGKGPEQWMRDALSSTIYSGTSEMQRGIIAGLL